MNKLTLTLLLALGAGSAAQAQLRPGLKAGASLASYVGRSVTGTQSIAGPYGGLTLNVPIGADVFFAVQPELLYAQKGSQQSGTLTTRQHYLDLAVPARLNAGGFIFEAGPQVGYLLHARTITDTPGNRTYRNITGALRRLDAGYVAGVGYQLRSGPSLGLRYNGGLTRLYDYNGTLRNSAFQLFVGYVFGAKD